ncbi:MAG: hypothetical protein CSA45_00095 [Gammaproteobacteria bacterium]|nr:MAG: hypothetical protein CSA45_00095 [Gammaproteobacteria bacterium]
MNKQFLLLPLAALAALALSGCNNLLYDGSVAPVYSGVSAKTGKKRPAPTVLNTTQSIEKPAAAPTVINSQKNPYSSTVQARRPSGMTNTTTNIPANVTTAPTASIENSTTQAQKSAANMSETVAGTATTQTPLSAGAQTSATNDPRIKEASAVLAAANGTADTATTAAQSINNQVNRPSAVMSKADKVTAKASATANSASNTVSNSAKTVKNTVQNTAKNSTQQAAVAATAATAASATAATTTVKTATAKASQAAVDTAKKVAPATTKSATKSLLQEARTAVSAGNYDKAASALERAHRIEPSNAKILYDIAQIRYAQGQYRQAESFASRAAGYSTSKTLSKKIWTLLSNARKALGNTTGANAAAQKAATF